MSSSKVEITKGMMTRLLNTGEGVPVCTFEVILLQVDSPNVQEIKTSNSEDSIPIGITVSSNRSFVATFGDIIPDLMKDLLKTALSNSVDCLFSSENVNRCIKELKEAK